MISTNLIEEILFEEPCKELFFPDPEGAEIKIKFFTRECFEFVHEFFPLHL